MLAPYRETVVGMVRLKQYVTSGHTSGKCFSRFMRGARLRMGMIRKQNEALTSVLAMVVCEAEAAERRVGVRRRRKGLRKNWRTPFVSCWLRLGQVSGEKKCL
jgi:hypothetical protein